MIAICIESSHQRGMGHFFRALNIWEYLQNVNEQAVILINDNEASTKILKKKNVPYKIVDYSDTVSNWEKNIIKKYNVDVWLLDKFETSMELAKHIKDEGIILSAIDDRGEGAGLIDLHFCGMLFHDIKGRHIYSGKEYMILNPEIVKYRRQRTELKKIIVTLGGSDTYGVTVNAVKILKKHGYSADIVVGPNFQHKELLLSEIDRNFKVYETVPSLIAKFNEYDLAITGGGVTCFEANASGLPCIIIANELHEVELGEYLSSFNGAVFAGYYKNIDDGKFDISKLDIPKMSNAALETLQLNGMDNIYKVIKEYRENGNAG